MLYNNNDAVMNVDLGNNILELFLNGNGEYDKNLQFETILVVIGAIMFFTYYFKDNYGFVIILLVFVTYITSMWLKTKRSKVTDFNKITLDKLRKIQNNANTVVTVKIRQISKTSAKSMSKREIKKLYKSNALDDLYMDANLIHFIDSLSALYEYNPGEYLLFVKGIDTILRLRREIEDYHGANGTYPVNISEMFQSTLELKTKTINNLHRFIYSVPKTSVMYKYIDDVLGRYNVLITRNLDVIHGYYKDNISQRGINNATKFVSYDTTKPYDELDNHPLVPRKSKGQSNRPYRQSETLEYYV